MTNRAYRTQQTTDGSHINTESPGNILQNSLDESCYQNHYYGLFKKEKYIKSVAAKKTGHNQQKQYVNTQGSENFSDNQDFKLSMTNQIWRQRNPITYRSVNPNAFNCSSELPPSICQSPMSLRTSVMSNNYQQQYNMSSRTR